MPSKTTFRNIILFTGAVLLVVIAVAAFQATRGNDADIAAAAILQDASASAAAVPPISWLPQVRKSSITGMSNQGPASFGLI